jgi:hypothetical protein
MILQAIKNDEQRKKLKKFHYAVTAFSTEESLEVFLSLANRNNLLILSHGNLKNVFNRVRGLLWDNVVARRIYAKKTRESRKKYQREWYQLNKERINLDKKLKRKGVPVNNEKILI